MPCGVQQRTTKIPSPLSLAQFWAAVFLPDNSDETSLCLMIAETHKKENILEALHITTAVDGFHTSIPVVALHRKRVVKALNSNTADLEIILHER